MKRALSWSQAQSCENATTPRCVCRCGGVLHGAARGRVVNLPVDDPHSPTRLCPVCEGEGGACRTCGGAGRVFVKSVPQEERADVRIPFLFEED